MENKRVIAIGLTCNNGCYAQYERQQFVYNEGCTVHADELLFTKLWRLDLYPVNNEGQPIDEYGDVILSDAEVRTTIDDHDEGSCRYGTCKHVRRDNA